MFFSRSKGEAVLVMDVQSSVIRGTLVIERDGSNPFVTYTHSVDIPYKPHARSGYLIKMALKGVEEIIRGSLRYLHLHPYDGTLPRKIGSIHYVLSSPWIISQARTIVKSFSKDTEISRRDVLALVSEERSRISSAQKDDLQVVEEKIFDVKLNGYSVASWEGRKARNVEAAFVISVAGKRMIERFIQACEPAISGRKASFHSSLFLQHNAVQRIMPDISSYALVHVHGELTDVAIVHAGSCSFFGSYPFGVNSIIRTISREAKVNIQTAASALSLSIGGHLDGAHGKTEETIIENMRSGWIGELRKLLKSGGVQIGMPHRVILSAHSHEDFFRKSFEAVFPGSDLRSLEIESILPFVSFEARAERLCTTGLYVAALNSLGK